MWDEYGNVLESFLGISDLDVRLLVKSCQNSDCTPTVNARGAVRGHWMCCRVFLGRTCCGGTGANRFAYTMIFVLKANRPRKWRTICSSAATIMIATWTMRNWTAHSILDTFSKLESQTNCQWVSNFWRHQKFGIIYVSKMRIPPNYTMSSFCN